ncbi:GmhA Phosphoheptose isomerase [Candidatus Pelagibacterales bacterium]
MELLKKNFCNKFLKFFLESVSKLNISNIQELVIELKKLRGKKGRVFFLGIGGSSANCSHAVNDFRKICNIESYSLTDNISELTARINDDGWENSMVGYLKVSNIKSNDALFVMSVGGGDQKKNVSVNIINALKFAKKKKVKIFGIIGKNGGYTAKVATKIILVPTVNKELITPIAESMQALVWHCIVSHPHLKINKTKW